MFTYLSRVSTQTFHLINPNQLQDVCVYEAGQLQQCLAFDAHLRSIQDTNVAGTVLAPAGYKDLARLFNESHQGPERFSTFERQQNGSLELCIHGLPVASELLGLESTSLPDASATLDGSDLDSEINTPEEINAYVMVEMPEIANTLSPVRERIEKVKDLAQELSKVYIARAQLEEEYALGLSRLTGLISAHHRYPSSGDLQACVRALLRETDKQAATHVKLSADIKREADGIVARLTGSSIELESIMSSVGSTLSEDVLRAGTSNTPATPQDMKFRSRCVKLQEKNLSIVKEVMWDYANHISTACVADDEACETVRVALEKLEPSEEAAKVILGRQPLPTPVGAPVAPSPSPSPSPTPATPTPHTNQGGERPHSGQVDAPSQYLFHVRALYDYESADTEDLSLEEGDTIGVTVISDDGWWKGELLSGPRRGAVGMIPSNFVTTQNVNLNL